MFNEKNALVLHINTLSFFTEILFELKKKTFLGFLSFLFYLFNLLLHITFTGLQVVFDDIHAK
jgi:hypothetical protein